MPIPFDNSYARLPERFYEQIAPSKVASPTLLRVNSELAETLGLELEHLNEDELAAMFAGNNVPEKAEPIALAYAGHQFGQFVPQLGDGRAVLLGEVKAKDGTRYDIQLKGSGKTRFSRRGDGRAALGPVIREYILSEAMHALGVPTTRALACVTTGEPVFRETMLPGGIITRVAQSHIRVGTFEYFAAREDDEALKILADYVIDRHYPEAGKADNPYIALLEHVCEAQAKLVAQWMKVGFIHGVMNTDNTAIFGETIDYGPCAFMDSYHPETVYSSIDHIGRYAFGNQPAIAQWNLASLGECLLLILDEDRAKAKRQVKALIESFPERFAGHWMEAMRNKLGLATEQPEDLKLIESLLAAMQQEHADYTNTFRALCDSVHKPQPEIAALFQRSEGDWLARWHERLKQENTTPEAIAKRMRQHNPAFIPRNHRVEEAITAAIEQQDLSVMDKLMNVLSAPYDHQPEHEAYTHPPKPEEVVQRTFCGT